MSVSVKRAYSPPSPHDGYRVLVDRLWPRGVSKASIKLDEWLRIIAPSDRLRNSYHRGLITWPEFKRQYGTELRAYQDDLRRLARIAKERNLTIVYSSRNEDRNNAVVVQQSLKKLGAG